MINKRFSDNGESANTFMNKGMILVKCPICQRCAFGSLDPTKIICHKCGFIKTSGSFSYGNGTFFEEDLWLETECCSEKLWAYNKEHLDFLEKYIQATLRERKPNLTHSLASRLPIWMKKSSNREKVLKGIQKLKDKLEDI